LFCGVNHIHTPVGTGVLDCPIQPPIFARRGFPTQKLSKKGFGEVLFCGVCGIYYGSTLCHRRANHIMRSPCRSGVTAKVTTTGVGGFLKGGIPPNGFFLALFLSTKKKRIRRDGETIWRESDCRTTTSPYKNGGFPLPFILLCCPSGCPDPKTLYRGIDIYITAMLFNLSIFRGNNVQFGIIRRGDH